jgi:hypothetical protein
MIKRSQPFLGGLTVHLQELIHLNSQGHGVITHCCNGKCVIDPAQGYGDESFTEEMAQLRVPPKVYMAIPDSCRHFRQGKSVITPIASSLHSGNELRQQLIPVVNKVWVGIKVTNNIPEAEDGEKTIF